MTVLVLGIGHHRERALRTLLRAGPVHLVERHGHPLLDMADASRAVADVRVPEQVRAAVAELPAGRPPTAVVTFADPLLELAAELAERAGCHGLPSPAARAAHNKDLMRARLHEVGVPAPRSVACRDPADLGRALDELALPVCVKPSNRAGSIGVARVDDRAHLPAAFEAAWDARLFGNGCVLVEEWVDGPEFSVETLTIGGETVPLAVTAKETRQAVEIGHTLPAHPSGEAELVEVACRAVDALGIDWSPAHTEVRLGAHGPAVIEVNARAGGDLIPDLLVHAGGADVYAALPRLGAGDRDVPVPAPARAAAIRFVLPVRPGTVTAVEGVAEASGCPGVVDVRATVEPGDRVGPLCSSLDRAGFVVAVAGTAEEAARRAADAAGRLRVVVADEPARPR